MSDKPKKPRRVRVDSLAGVAAAIVAGGKKITLPSGIPMTANERLIFTELCDEFSKSELTGHKIRLVALLAKQMAMLDEQQVLLHREGSVFVNSHGKPARQSRSNADQCGPRPPTLTWRPCARACGRRQSPHRHPTLTQ